MRYFLVQGMVIASAMGVLWPDWRWRRDQVLGARLKGVLKRPVAAESEGLCGGGAALKPPCGSLDAPWTK